MPELPEVETTRRGIEPYLKNRIVADIIIRQPKLRWVVPEYMASKYSGLTITGVMRRGKYLLIHFHGKESANTAILIHLGMSGSLRILDQAVLPKKHDHIDIVLDNNKILRFHDPRRFGAFLDCSVEEPLSHPLLAKLGPEPLSDEFSGEYLYLLSRNRTLNIKNFIMDSHVVVGLGNIYATEILFEAGIHPTRLAGKISHKRYASLVIYSKQIIYNAIQQGGTTLRDFVNANGKPGYFKQQLRVYGREDQPCIACQTPIRRLKQSQRSSWYCPQCQH